MDDFTGIPLVTVIIPTYNREYIVRKAIESVFWQTYQNFQLIIVDDGSTDGTEALLKSYPGIEYIRQENSGPSKARNTGLGHARGVYIATLDSDDIWEPDFLTECISRLEQDKLDFVFANWLQLIAPGHGFDFLSNYKWLGKNRGTADSPWSTIENAELRRLYLLDCPSPSSSLVFRRTSLKSGWNEDMHIGDDWCMLLDLILSPTCGAACCMKRLWVKRSDGKNIYDGQDSLVILELLRVKDLNLVIERNKERFTTKELKLLRYELACNTFQLIIRKLFRKIDFSDNLVLFRKVASTQRYVVFRILYRMIINRIKYQLNPRTPVNRLRQIPLSIEKYDSMPFN